ncbi:MAG: cytochrome c peroxidase [Deltaproteobacteria bacterium]
MTARRFLLPAAVACLLGGLPARAADLAPLPPPPAPADNPASAAKVALGKMLFFDRRLSGDGTMSCATCHDPESGYGDRLAVSLSYPTTKNWRNAPTLINVAYRTPLFWDGRAGSLEEQALFPVASAFEMNQNIDFLEEELKEVPEYVEAFRAAFGGEITRERIAMALAAFQRTILSADTPLDRFLRGDRAALTSLQEEGRALFVGKAGCVRCHGGPLLSDGKFHNLGVPEDPSMSADPRVAATRRFVAKVSGYAGYRELSGDPGRFLVTGEPGDWKAFLTPPLRNVAVTGPYMHNGAFRTLSEVIEFYDRGGGDDPKKDGFLSPLGLSAGEKEALRAFLAEALSGTVTPVKPPRIP